MGNFDLSQILKNYIPLPNILKHGLREGTLNRRSVMSSLKFNPKKDLVAETDQRIWVTAFLCCWAAPETLRNVCFLPEAPGINTHELTNALTPWCSGPGCSLPRVTGKTVIIQRASFSWGWGRRCFTESVPRQQQWAPVRMESKPTEIHRCTCSKSAESVTVR